ncbi:hypothetical protein K7X08_034779 [Anisodus acutangulus]|uniref:NAC domain-containing protein n=1 Tax=Anisodus acutangulus TaxID=402998 RepID=A0A9Q1LJR4_9SOLA|nr:hypothetical protein K7X08_034779 [Anisodus acutangulus]
MSAVRTARRHVMGVRFHPTDVELINYLKRFFKGECFSSQCPIQLADIYRDQPPWEIFGATEEKVRYFITRLKKRKSEHIRLRSVPNQEEDKREKKVKDHVAVTYNMEELQDVVGIIEAMLNGPDGDNCTTQAAEDQEWDLIINGVCDEQVDEVENTTTFTTTLEEEAYGQPLIGIEQVQGHGADDIGSDEFWKAMKGILGEITVNIPDDRSQLDDQSRLLLDNA